MALKVDYNIHMKAINDPLPELKETLENEMAFLYHAFNNFVNYDSILQDFVLDMGCGNGRPLIDLVKKLAEDYPLRYIQGHFFGIDHNQEFIDAAKKSGEKLENIYFKKMSVLDNTYPLRLDSLRSDYFDLVFSTFNTMGCFDFKEVNEFIGTQHRITKKDRYRGGRIINILWKTDDDTTDFLKRHYEHIGLKISYIDNDITISEAGIIRRRHPEEVSMLYKNNNIEWLASKDLGLFTAYVGRPK